MRVTRISLSNFRNISDSSLSPSPEINVITGENAQGKTNLLEAIWLFCGAKSFRGAKDSELIAHENESARIEMDFYSHGYEQSAKITLSSGRETLIGGVPVSNQSELAENFCAVVFSPVHLSLIKDGPEKRRKFIDTAISQLRPRYSTAVSQYNRAVMGRNAILKDTRFHSELFDLLSAWEEKIANTGAYIINQRQKYIEALNEIAPGAYDGLSNGKETFFSCYSSSDTTAEQLLSALKNARQNDIQTGTTSVGPHRDDIEFLIDEKSARTYGSQGQQRSAVIALKLAEASIIKRVVNEPPVILLDDVLSELDETRQGYILNHIGDGQVFITCCDLRQVDNKSTKKAGKVFLMDKGEPTECTSTLDKIQ